MTTNSQEKNCVVSGIGMSQVGRRLGRSGLDLTLEAANKALRDAGLKPSDIDGLASWPGFTAQTPGFSPVSLSEVKENLGLALNWYSAGMEASQMSALVNACMAVASGQARHVMCFRTMTEATAMAGGERSSNIGHNSARVSDQWQWQVPFHATSAVIWVALIAQRYFHEFGTRREQLAQIALNARRNAQRNPNAVYRSPLTLEEYLASRIISTPLCLYDCDIPIDGSVAYIVSHRETAADLQSVPILVEAVCSPLYGRDTWDQMPDLTRFAAEDAGKRLWSRTELRPKDVDVGALYDGFSFLTMLWLEGLGFCGRGEAGDFIDGGERIALNGQLPLSTGGGQLSCGRLHGFVQIHEAVTQLRGLGGERQVPGDPRVAIVSNGGGPIAGAALFVRD